MKLKIYILLGVCYLLSSGICQAQASRYSRKNLFGVFDGRTPCQEIIKQLHEPDMPDCIKIKWRLILYKDSITGGPASFILWSYMYDHESPAQGKWHIIKGTKSNPEATVYQIDLPGKKPLLLQRGDENVLFFLDNEKNLMTGNSDFGFTLNRKIESNDK